MRRLTSRRQRSVKSNLLNSFKGTAEIERKLGKKVRSGEVAKAWDAIEGVLGKHNRNRWHAAVMKGESWALPAAKFMVGVDPEPRPHNEEYLEVSGRWLELKNGM